MMGRKHGKAAKAFLVIWILFALVFVESVAEMCVKIDDCSCVKQSTLKIISLRNIDGGARRPAFKGIPAIEPSNFVFDWNPCTKFSEGSGCKDMLMCQTLNGSTIVTFPCAQTVSYFKVNGDGTTTIVYQQVTDSTGYKRSVEITLECDEASYPGETGRVAEHYSMMSSLYTMTFRSRCACDNGCLNNAEEGDVIGSVLI